MDILIAEDDRTTLQDVVTELVAEYGFDHDPSFVDQPEMVANFIDGCRFIAGVISHPQGHTVTLIATLASLGHFLGDEPRIDAGFFDMKMPESTRNYKGSESTDHVCLYLQDFPHGPVYLTSSDKSYQRSELLRACDKMGMNIDAVTMRLRPLDKIGQIIAREIDKLIGGPA